jgi:hypothetical protein
MARLNQLIARLAGDADLDFVLLDTEHEGFDFRTLAQTREPCQGANREEQ